MKRSRGIYIEFETSGPPSRAPGIRDVIAGVFGVIGASLHEALRLAAASSNNATGGASSRRRATDSPRRSKTRRSTAARSREQRRLPAGLERALSVLALPAGRLPSPEHLRRARNAAIMNAHPDRGGTTAAAARVIEAYRIVAGALPQS